MSDFLGMVQYENQNKVVAEQAPERTPEEVAPAPVEPPEEVVPAPVAAPEEPPEVVPAPVAEQAPAEVAHPQFYCII